MISRSEIGMEVVYYLDQSGIHSVSYPSHAPNACMADPPFGRRASSIAVGDVTGQRLAAHSDDLWAFDPIAWSPWY